MSKKVISILLAALMAASLMSGCGKEEKKESSASVIDQIKESEAEEVKEEPQEEPEEVVEENHDGMYRSELTGEWIDESLKDQRPIAAMVDNELTALPHFGLSKADVVYEMMNSTKNDRITRLMVLVKDWDKIEQLGSIRSTRPTNVMLAAEWNAILCHDGGPFYINDYIAKPYTNNFSGGFSRVNNGKAREFTEYIMEGDLQKMLSNSKYSTEYNKYYEGEHFTFAEEELDLSDAKGVKDCEEIKLPFKHNGSRLVYNKDTQTYDYYEYGDLHTDPGNNDAPLTFKNVIIQNVSFSQLDENGYLIYNILAGDFDGYYCTNGKAIPIKWYKTGEATPTMFFDTDKNPIEINVGKTYITLVPEDSWSSLSIK